MSIIEKSTQSLVCFLLVTTSFFIVSLASAQMSMADAVNTAGTQRMLTQRMLKNYAMVGMGNEYSNPGEDLQKNIALFDTSLKSLKALNINAEVNANLAKDEQLWQPIKKQIEAKPDITKVEQLQKDLDALLASCHKTTGLIAQASGAKATEIVNVSGRQRMLSQRMAALYMLQVWGVKDPEFKDKLNKTMDEFAKAQDVLLQSKLNTPEINAGLAKVKRLFKWFEVMGRSKSGKYVPAIISKSADKMLKEMNTITTLYIKAI